MLSMPVRRKDDGGKQKATVGMDMSGQSRSGDPVGRLMYYCCHDDFLRTANCLTMKVSRVFSV